MKFSTDGIFKAIAGRISYCFALASFSLTGAWFAAGYAYFFATPLLKDWSPENYPAEFTAFAIMLLIATIGHYTQFGMFSRAGFSGPHRAVRETDAFMAASAFRDETDSLRLQRLLQHLASIPQLNAKISFFWATLIMLVIGTVSMVHTSGMRDAAVIFCGWVVAATVYTGFTYIITDHFAGNGRVAVKKELLRRNLECNEHDSGVSLKLRFGYLLLVNLLSSVILAAYLRYSGADWISAGIFILLTVFAAGLLISLNFVSINRSLRQITDSALDLGLGGNGDLPMISSETEFREFTAGFEKAAEQVVSIRTRLNRLIDSYQRFVPREFLQHLKREDITDVQLGDQVEATMTILFSDIRNFTGLSETMSPEENFNFLNSYLKKMSPIINQYGGFVDKFIGDAIMALFPHGPGHAVRAALEMQRELGVYNNRRLQQGYPPVSVGMGIHTGRLMLGTIGASDRMQGTVISDAVNLASRIEGLTKKFGAEILISSDAHETGKISSHFSSRFLCRTKVKGKRKAVGVHEILNSSDADQLEKKMRTLPLFEAGVNRYFERNFSEAADLFRQVLDVNPEDRAAVRFAEACRKNSDPAVF